MAPTGSVAVAMAATIVAVSASPSAETPDPVLFRVFLQPAPEDSGDWRAASIVSLGDYTRVDDRVVLSLPLGLDPPTSPGQLVTLPAAAIDWRATERYADAARSARYALRQGESDFADLRVAVGRAMAGLATGEQADWELWSALQTRQRVVSWIETSHGYRQTDALDVVSVLDEAMTMTAERHGLDPLELTTVSLPSGSPLVALLPSPDLREVVGQAMTVARLTAVPAERIVVLETVIHLLDGWEDEGASDWTAGVRASAERELAAELGTSRAYGELADRLLGEADQLAGQADVRGVWAVLDRAVDQDAALGRRRPNQMSALLTALEHRLDLAQALRLERDHWSLRVEAYRRYRLALTPHLERLADERPWLDDVRLLAGPPVTHLAGLGHRLQEIAGTLERLEVPAQAEELHQLFRQAVALAVQAGVGRHAAVRQGDLETARAAASAAAGGLLLLDRAVETLEQSLRPPELN